MKNDRWFAGNRHRVFPLNILCPTFGLSSFVSLLFFVLALTGCIRTEKAAETPLPTGTHVPTETARPAPPTPDQSDPVRRKRPKYMPGELVDYTAMDGDTLPALAADRKSTRLNSSHPTTSRMPSSA